MLVSLIVCVMLLFTSKPSKDHWLGIERVMRYLIGTKNYSLFYKKQPTVIEAFSDADWNTLSSDSLSTTGYIFTLGSDGICWKSKKQTIIANSTNCYGFKTSPNYLRITPIKTTRFKAY